MYVSLYLKKNRARDFHIYFSFKIGMRLCVSVLELLSTLVIKILISFQKTST